MRRNQFIRYFVALSLSTTTFGFAPVYATIIGDGVVSPVSILGLQDADITGQLVFVEDGTLTVNGGSNLTADALISAGNPATTSSQIVVTGAGTRVNLVTNDPVIFNNRFGIGDRGTASLTVSDGAFIDGASIPCDPNLCNAFFGNFAGSTSDLIVTGAGSRIDTLNSLVFGSGSVTTEAVEGFTAGIPGGTSTTTAQILDGGVVNAKGPGGSVRIAAGPEGSGVTGSEQVNATVTVDGLGSVLNVEQDGGLRIGDGTNTTGVLNVQNQGALNVTRGLLSAGNGGTGTLNVDGAGTVVTLSTVSSGRLSIGNSTTGNLNISNGAVVDAGGDAATCASGSVFCGVFFGNGAGSTANVDISGEGSALLYTDGLRIAATGVRTQAEDGFDFGTPGGTTNATVDVRDGALLSGDSIVIGRGPDDPGALGTEKGIGVLNVTGKSAGGVSSSVVATAIITVGQRAGGDGTLNITDGASLTVVRPIDQEFSGINIARDSNDAVGRVNIDGSGTTVLLRGDQAFVNVGRNGDGGLEVSNGASLTLEAIDNAAGDATNSFFQIGRDDGAVGNMRVSDATVTMSGTGQKSFIRVGRRDDSDGTLLIENGGKLLNTDTGGSLTIGREDAISRGVVTVTGSGSVLQTAASNVDTVLGEESRFFVGANGNGTLNILDGGRVDGGIFGRVGNGAGGVGDLNIDGKDLGGIASTLRLSGSGPNVASGALDGQGAFLSVGFNGIGTADVTNGGKIIIDGLTQGDNAGFQAGRGAGSFGTINVIGEGSSIEVFGTLGGLANIGRNDGSVGALNVLNGGAVSMNDDGQLFVGRNVGSVGTVVVSGLDASGNGSVLDGGRFIGVGVQEDEVTSGGTGTLIVTNGGRVVADTVLVGGNGLLSGAGGTITANVAAFDGGIIAPGSSPGDLTILGNLDLSGGGVLQIELGSINDFDRLFIGGGFVIDDTTSIVFSFIDGAADDPDLLQNFDLSSFFFDIDPQNFDENDPTASAQAFDLALFGDANFSAQGNGFIGEIDVDGNGGLRVVNITSTTSVPEPGTLVLLGAGLMGLGYARRRRKAA